MAKTIQQAQLDFGSALQSIKDAYDATMTAYVRTTQELRDKLAEGVTVVEDLLVERATAVSIVQRAQQIVGLGEDQADRESVAWHEAARDWLAKNAPAKPTCHPADCDPDCPGGGFKEY
jgi:hypothetical protein